MKARWLTLLTVVLCCSACGAPSLRHKKEVNKLLAAGDFAAAEQKLEEAKNKNDMKRYYELLKQISDVEYKKILQKRKENPRYVLSDEEIRVIILYRLKYGLPFHSLPFSSEMLTRRCPSDLKEQFEKLGIENGENFRYVSHRRARCRNMEETDS